MKRHCEDQLSLFLCLQLFNLLSADLTPISFVYLFISIQISVRVLGNDVIEHDVGYHKTYYIYCYELSGIQHKIPILSGYNSLLLIAFILKPMTGISNE